LIARINCAWVVVIAVLWIRVDSILAITSRDSAWIFRWRNWNWFVNTLSSRAVILSTCIIVVTNNWSVNTSNRKIASIDGACIIIITILWSIDASFLGITRIYCAFVFINTDDRSVNTLSRCRIASVSSAVVIVIAINCFLVETSVKSAQPNLAFVGTCCILCNKINWSVLASNFSITSIGGAWVIVVTANQIMMNDSRYCVAVVFSACIVVIDWFVCEDASCAIITSINSAWIVVIASDWNVNTSLNSVARILCAFVSISTSNRSMNTETSVQIAAVNGTCIAVVTIDINIDAFSRVLVARNGLAILLLANNRSEDALSV
jgi:hypothetical protein